jgi:hypothetical protein
MPRLTLWCSSDRLMPYFIIFSIKNIMTLCSASKKILLTAVFCTSPLFAYADAAQDATIKELIAVTHMDSGLSTNLSQQAGGSAIPLLQEYLAKNKVNLTPAQQQKLQANLKGYVDQQRKRAAGYFDAPARKSQIQAALIKGYAAQFSNDELKQILAFYSSSAGKKLMAQQGPIINGVVGGVLKSADSGLLPQLRAAAATYAKSVTK